MNKNFFKKVDEQHNLLIEETKIRKKPKKIRISGKELHVFRNVLDPTFGLSSKILLKSMKIKKNDIVLDMGTGCGVQAIFAALKGAKKVIGIDINKDAVKCAKYNVKKHILSKIVEIRYGNLFAPIQNEKFDEIVANLPFRAKKANSIFELSIRDEKSKILKEFIKKVTDFLKPNGKIFLCYSNKGNTALLNKLLEKYEFRYEKVNEMNEGSVRYFVYEIRK
jgi:release factor glutamine methyltransferase